MAKRDFLDYIVAGATILGGLAALDSLFNNKQSTMVIHYFPPAGCNPSVNSYPARAQYSRYDAFNRITIA